MAQIIASTKEISNKKQALVTLSNSLKTQLTDLETVGRSCKREVFETTESRYCKDAEFT